MGRLANISGATPGSSCEVIPVQLPEVIGVSAIGGIAALAISRFGKMSPDALLVKLSLGANPLRCPPSPYDPGETGQPATCKGPSFYNNFYGAGLVDALDAIR